MNKTKWKEEEISFIKNNYNNYSNAELGEILNRTSNSIQMKIKRLGLKRDDQYTYNISFFHNIDTEEKAYWLGFIYADGYTQYNPQRRNSELGIELQIGDIKHLKKFNKAINGNVEIKIKDRYDARSDKTHTHCIIRLYKKQIVEDLINMGVIPNKSHVITFPKLQKKLIIPFIRGFFDGDGCLRLNTKRNCHSFDFACASIDFVNSLRTILYGMYNINSYICKDKNIYRLCIGGLTNAYLFGTLLYDNATIYLDRKYQKFYTITKQYDIKNRLRIK